MNRITWIHRGDSYTKGNVGRFTWCTILRVNDTWNLFKPKYKYVISTLVKSAGTVETHQRSYGGYFLSLEDAKREAEDILDIFLTEVNAIPVTLENTK